MGRRPSDYLVHETKVWGKWWLGAIRSRIWLDEYEWKTFYHLSVWKFTIGMSFPSKITRKLGFTSSSEIHPFTKRELLQSGEFKTMIGVSFNGG